MNITIRRWAEQDLEVIVPLVHAFLQETFEANHAYWIPSAENVKTFTIGGLTRAKAGDPVLAAWSGAHCLAFHACMRAPEYLHRKQPVLITEGIYVVPSYRGYEDITAGLQLMIDTIAREQGYKELQGIVLNPASYALAKKIGWAVKGVWMTKEIG
jgi:hypothetical protein